MTKNEKKRIFLLWLFYVLSIAFLTLLLNYIGLSDLKTHSLKEVIFAQWGYGWDGMHYIKIAQEGYHFPLQAFFPLYPMLIRLLHVGLPLTLAYRVNVILLLPLLYMMYLFAKSLGFESRSFISLAVLLSFPSAFFLQANYTETPYILIAVSILLCLSKKRYICASLLGILLCLTKISGLAIIPVIFFSYIKDSDVKSGKLIRGLLLGLVPLLGLILYFYYLETSFGSYKIFFQAQMEWGREVLAQGMLPAISDTFLSIYRAVSVMDVSVYRRLSELLAVILAIWTLVKSFRKIPWEVWLYSVFHVMIPLATGSILSFNRLLLLAFPLLLFLGYSLKNKVALCAYFIVTICLQAYGVYLFTNGIFVG